MQRRVAIAGLLALSGPYLGLVRRASASGLTASGPVRSDADGQVIENLDITATSGNALAVVHAGVTVRNCRITHGAGHGVYGNGAPKLVLRQVHIERVGVFSHDAASKEYYNNVFLRNCPAATLHRVRAVGGSSNVYVEGSEACRLNELELHDARGPFPRGQNVQFNRSPRSVLQDFSAENGPTSWTEDNVSVFRSDECVVRRGLVAYNNSPTGDGVMLEGSSNCLVHDVDALQQGNGAFAAVPEGDARSGGCVFLRCRTRASYNGSRDGRPPPSSNGLSFYVMASPGAPKHTVADCHYDALANPGNLIWDARALNRGWSLIRRPFTPRKPVRLEFAG
jgi:hypothetical protein